LVQPGRDARFTRKENGGAALEASRRASTAWEAFRSTQSALPVLELL
jgi:hypothetical protein